MRAKILETKTRLDGRRCDEVRPVRASAPILPRTHGSALFERGEVKPLRGVGRREVGHGRLAEKALEPVLPSQVDFPYMMRVVSETTTCN